MTEIIRDIKDIEKKVKQDEIYVSDENGSMTIKSDGIIKFENHLPSPLEKMKELETKIDELESTITTLQEQLNLKVDKHKIIEANKITIGDSRVIIDKEGINVNRPDGVVWMEDEEGK